jgi:hypothetical protein
VFSELRKATISFVISVRLSPWNISSHWRIFIKFYIGVFFENLWRKFKCKHNLTRITVNLHEDQYIFLITSRSFLLRMRNITQKMYRENQNTLHMFNNMFKLCLFMIMCANIVGPAGHMRFACWIIKATDTGSECVIIINFLLQK